MAEPERRRRRLRPPSPAGGAPVPPGSGEPAAEPAPAASGPAPSAPAASGPAPSAPAASAPPVSGAPPGAGRDERESERGLRGLVGSGSSQVSLGAALRARDAARPTDRQLAEAADNLVIVRRNWMPREELPRR